MKRGARILERYAFSRTFIISGAEPAPWVERNILRDLR